MPFVPLAVSQLPTPLRAGGVVQTLVIMSGTSSRFATAFDVLNFSLVYGGSSVNLWGRGD